LVHVPHRAVSFVRVRPAAERPQQAVTKENQPTHKRMTYMQEQTMVMQTHVEAGQQASKLAAVAVLAKAPVPLVPAPLLHRSALVLAAPSLARVTPASSALDVLRHSGLVRHLSKHDVLLMPQGKRVLQKFQRRLDEELQTLSVQEMEVVNSTTNHEADSAQPDAAAGAPYPAALHSSLAQITNLVAPSFRTGALTEASLHISRPAAGHSSPSALWSGSKTLDDVILFDTKHSAGLERYHALVDAMRLTLTAVGKTHAVDTIATSEGLAQVDADLAHELHVEVPHGGRGSCSLLRCTKCDYAAKPERAISIATSTTKTAASKSVSPNLAVNEQFQAWARSHLTTFLPQHAIDQLHLDEVEWKVALLQEANADASSERTIYAILLRSDHHLNLAAVNEHIESTTKLELIKESDQMQAIQRAENKEILIDQALIPEELDLDMEVIDEEEAKEDEDLDEMEGDEVPSTNGSNETAAVNTAEDPSDLLTPDPRLLSRMTAQLKKRSSDAPIDFVQLEAEARGLNANEERQKALKEGSDAQRREWEERTREKSAKTMELKKLAEQLSDKQSAQSEDDAEETQPSLEDPAVRLELSNEKQSISASFIPSFTFSRQGFFRTASAGEACGVCAQGELRSVRTEILANTVFVGRQELVVEEAEEDDSVADGPQPFRRAFRGKRDKSLLAAQRPKEPKKVKVKKFLHTSMARVSKWDAVAFAVGKNVFQPKSNDEPDASAANPLSSIPTIHYPPLLAPYQIVIVPVLQKEVAPTRRDHQQVKRKMEETEQEKLQAATVRARSEQLYQDIIQSSKEAPTPSASSAAAASKVEIRSPSLEGDVLIDDSYTLPTSQRVHHAISLGAPIILLLSPSSVSKGYCTLLLNKRNVPIEPRRIALEGLPQLMHKMSQTNYGAILQARQRRQQQAMETEEEMKRMLAESGEELEEELERL
jgi:hypothetical protein